jgi:hypothetical protein
MIRKYLSEGFPKIICLCGSTRFVEAFQAAQLEETLAGNIVLTIGSSTKSDQDLFSHLSKTEWDSLEKRLIDLHLRKIDLADEIFVINVNGYIGESGAREIAYAKSTGKPVKYLEPLVEKVIL